MKKRVLFVCLGNICRSPAAEGVFLHLIAREGLEDQFVVDSAGTGGWHVGNPADRRIRAAAERRGIHLFPSTPLTQSTIHHIIGHVSSLPNAHGVVIISTRTTTPIQPHDSTLLIHTTVACRSAGFELIDWVVVGSGGLYCPRSLTDAPDPWSASATFL